jgi:lipid-binding SYLF domain-containing protein
MTPHFFIFPNFRAMKKYVLNLFLSIIFALPVISQTAKDQKIINAATEAREDFLKADGLLKNMFRDAYGYVIFPSVGKGGLGVGGAYGNGAVYEKGKLVGMAKLMQLNIGFQAGAQSFREVIFFENKDVFERFKNDKIQLAAQASAVVATEGAAAAAKYTNGVMIFTQVNGGLMYEASVGGQKFNYKDL